MEGRARGAAGLARLTRPDRFDPTDPKKGVEMTIEIKPFDAAKYLTHDEDQKELIVDALGTGHCGCIAAALGIVARARGMSDVTIGAGPDREAGYATLREGGNPTLGTVLRVVQALGLELTVTKRTTGTA